MENMFGFDTNQVDTTVGIKAGDYPAVINTAKMGKTKVGNKLMFTLSYKIVGDVANGKIFDFNNFVVDTPTSVGAKLFFKLVEDCGLDKSEITQQSDLVKLIGKKITVNIGKKKDKEGNEEQYSRVLYTKKFESSTNETEAEF